MPKNDKGWFDPEEIEKYINTRVTAEMSGDAYSVLVGVVSAYFETLSPEDRKDVAQSLDTIKWVRVA